MARRSSLTKKLVVVGILALACFGGYTLYKQNQDTIESGRANASKKLDNVRKALER